MNVIVSHPVGNANVRALLFALEKEGLLYEFSTCIATFKSSGFFGRLAKIPGLEEFNRRLFDDNISDKTNMYPLYEMIRLLSNKLNLKYLVKHEKGIFCIDSVMKSLDLDVSKEIRKKKDLITAFYGYEDVSLNSFKVASELGINKLYDLPTGHWRTLHRIFKNEIDRLPNWVNTMPGMHDSNEKLDNKDAELEMADVVFVASSFTKKTLNEFPGSLKRIEVIPYGFPNVFKREYSRMYNSKLKLLFVGKLSQQKGIADLFTAIRPYLSHLELTLIGHKSTNDCKALDDELKKHKWIPTMAHEQLLEKMRDADILIFPSLFDGYGLVISESMSQGTPVLASTHSAGPDLINDGVNGWLMEPGDVERIQEVIEELLQDYSLVEKFGKAALETAALRPWSKYGLEMVDSIKNFPETK